MDVLMLNFCQCELTFSKSKVIFNDESLYYCPDDSKCFTQLLENRNGGFDNIGLLFLTLSLSKQCFQQPDSPIFNTSLTFTTLSVCCNEASLGPHREGWWV